MKFTYTPERLTITCDEAEREELREILEDKGHFSEWTEAEFMERIVCNLELEWINPADTGDLTDAPILGIRDYCNELPDGSFPIVQRWGYEPYAVRSFLSDLMENGEAVFLSNW